MVFERCLGLLSPSHTDSDAADGTLRSRRCSLSATAPAWGRGRGRGGAKLARPLATLSSPPLSIIHVPSITPHSAIFPSTSIPAAGNYRISPNKNGQFLTQISLLR